MRRTTSALTTTILGAALATSTVSAQQILPAPGARRSDASASAPASTSAPGSTSTPSSDAGPGTNTDPIVGMAATRGARYLLRNGLDFINYQEYERALKYLREAEARQKELSNSERLTLKQAIERAQRGLREAVGSQAPYALSQRTRRPGGFSPAKPDTQIAAKASTVLSQDKDALARTSNREGDDQGQPIRLTGGEVISPIPSPAPASTTPAPVSGDPPQPLSIAADQPRQPSGMSKLPTTPGSPEAIAEKLTRIADAPPQPAGDLTKLASTPAAKPNLDAAVAAPADLLSPLPPVDGAQTGAQKPELPQPTTSVASVATTPGSQPQGSAAPVDTITVAPALSAADPAPTAAPAVDLSKPATPESVQPEPVPPTKPTQLAPTSDAAAPNPPVTVDAKATTALAPPAAESFSKQAAAAPAPINLEQLTDAGAKVSTTKSNLDAAVAPQADPRSLLPPVSGAQTGAQKPELPELPVTVGTVATSPEPLPQGIATPVNTAAKPPATVDANAVAVSAPGAPESVSGQPAATPTPISPAQPADAGAKPSSSPVASLNDQDSVPLPPLGSESDKLRDSTPPTGKDSSPPTAALDQARATPSATTSTPPAAATSEDLPPLPQQLAREPEPKRDDAKAKASPAEPIPSAAETVPPTVALVPDDLPPLPQSGGGAADSKTKSDPLPPAAEELPALPPGVTANQPASPEPIPVPDPVVQSDPAQPLTTPSPAAPATSGATSPVAVKTPEPAPATETSSGSEPARFTVGGEAAAAVPAPAQAEARVTEPTAAVPLAAPAIMGAVMNPATASPDLFVPQRANPPSTLRPDLQRRVEEVARMQDEKLIRDQARPAPNAQPAVPGPSDSITDLRTQTQTQVDISRAPSPAEARPIRAIPVPEDWVPLGRREWSAQRKYWAAAATCHLPLYFQDPMLERYGHSVEQYFGPLGRYMAYPVDDHTQTTQRMQMVQPFFSVGLFAWQILTLPYALVVDPPWEAQYDLGYWRPGDKIPSDLYYQPLHGTGPPFVGRNY